jgi:acyl-CoA synthetase (NDP forming)
VVHKEQMMSFDGKALMTILDGAAADGRHYLFEHEIYHFLRTAGCRTPASIFVPAGAPPPENLIEQLAGPAPRDEKKIVLKIVHPEIMHKTDVGGIALVPATLQAVQQGMGELLREVPRRYRLALEERHRPAPAPYAGLEGVPLEEAVAKDIRGILAVEFIPLAGKGAAGSEVLVALRDNREFGPVLTLGLGGIDTELFGALCHKGIAVVSGSPLLLTEQQFLELFRSTLAYRRLAGLTRGGQRLVPDESLRQLMGIFRQLALTVARDDANEGPWTVSELEINPFGASAQNLVALDGILKFRPRKAPVAPRPLPSLEAMLRPQSVGIIGVSNKGMNMGRIILRNILEVGFPQERVYLIRPDSEAIDGVRCVPTVKELPERVDLFVVAVGAQQVPELMEQLVEHNKAVGVVLIPGGMGEKEGGAEIELRLKKAIARAREQTLPLVVNGGNSLGIVSRPGRYHTIFIPKNKLPLPADGKGNVAFISQSGAYMISRMSKLDWISPRYAISLGNQVDLTASDFLRYLRQDRAVQTFALYLEGFQDVDGLALAKTVGEISGEGRDVIFYKAGRTAEGKSATSGHTASLAGDYDVCEAIMLQAGAYVAETFTEFLNLTKLSSLMGQRPWRGRHLAALSNAGYETVGIADNLRGRGWSLEMAQLSAETRAQLAQVLKRGQLDSLVDVRNPLDLTPMANDAVHEEVLRCFFADPGVDLVLCATIPLSPMMATLDGGASPEESIHHEGSLVHRLARLLPQSDKPLMASVDCGALYDPMARALEAKGIPTFRSADEALLTIGKYVTGKLAAAERQRPSSSR